MASSERLISRRLANFPFVLWQVSLKHIIEIYPVGPPDVLEVRIGFKKALPCYHEEVLL